MCPACWPNTRSNLAARRATAGNAALAELRARGEDPSNPVEAAAKRSAALSQRKREHLAWQPPAPRTGGASSATKLRCCHASLHCRSPL